MLRQRCCGADMESHIEENQMIIDIETEDLCLGCLNFGQCFLTQHMAKHVSKVKVDHCSQFFPLENLQPFKFN